MNLNNKKSIIKQCFAEFFGTGLITFFSISPIFTTTLTSSYLNHWEISFFCGIGVSIAIYFSTKISDTHLNPAITIFFYLSSRCNPKKVFPYIFSQILGAFFFTILVYFLYYYYFIIFEQQHHIIRGTKKSLQLAAIFCAYPKNNTNFLYNFIIEILNTSVFMIILLELSNKKKYIYKNSKIFPLLIGILVFIMTASIGLVHNIIINPARDLGPRIFLSINGWGLLAFTSGLNIPYFLIPLFGPIIGTNFGGWIYSIFFLKYKKISK